MQFSFWYTLGKRKLCYPPVRRPASFMVDCVVDFNTFEDMFSTWLYIENQEILSFVIAMHGEQYLFVS